MFQKKSKIKPHSKKTKIIISLGVGAGLVILCVAIFAIQQQLLRWQDPAYYAAKPVEDALIKAGAVKACSYGSDGHGTDNNNPWYESYYRVDRSLDSTRTLLLQLGGSQAALLQNGPGANTFVSSSNKTIVNVTLLKETVALSDYYCPGVPVLESDANHTVIRLQSDY